MMTRRPQRLAAATGIATAAALLLTGCISTGGPSQSQQDADEPDSDGPLVLQSRFTDAEKGGIEDLVADFNESSDGEVKLNSIPTQTFNEQLPTYLTSEEPPDVYTWYAGQATRDFADQDLLLDVSDVWEDDLSGFPDALRTLSQDSDGNEVFVPTGYYWWGVYYFKSDFEKLGVEPPKTWEDFLDVSKKIQDQGVNPFTAGLSDNAWLASAWFDYLDLRINGGDFHLALLNGDESYDSPEVKKVFDALAEVLPYFDPNVLGLTQNQAISDFVQGKSAMYLLGAWAQPSIPEDKQEDLAFFQFPVIDPDVPVAEEAPTDGFVASAQTTRPHLVKEFMSYLADPETQAKLVEGQDGTSLAANPDTKQELNELATQGKKMLESADQITQFYNRDAGDAQQAPADAALTKFFASPDKVDQIMSDWQDQAERVRGGQ